MRKMLFKDKELPPADDVLRDPLYAALVEGLAPEWKWYRDGGGWLCKVSHGSRTVFWFSVWEGFYKVSFYFMERNLEGLAALGTTHGKFEKEFGRMLMLPLVFDIPRGTAPSAAIVAEIRRVAEFKKKAK